LGTTVTNQNYIHEEVKSRLNLGNACHHFAQKNLASALKTLIIIYKTIILPIVLYGCKTWSLTAREEHRLRVLKNRLWKTFGPNREKWLEDGEDCIIRSFKLVHFTIYY
jgi:hypothetical protein